MTEKEFNLLREPWIRVMRNDCQVEEVSLSDALLHAHEYRELAGELPTQNAALLRLLLAILHAVFERVDVEGREAEIETAKDAYNRWAELWKYGRFPEEPLTEYFEKQLENFWLFHPTRPFWQIADIPSDATRPQSEPVQKLNGTISESGNKTRLFSERSKEQKEILTNAETARWLICMNQYDDNTLKTGLGVSLLGQFVVIYAKGNTLFETLMLNFVLTNHHGEPWEEIGSASWEQNISFDENVKKIAYPHDPVSMLSYHSRFGKLIKTNDLLECYKAPKGGICYEEITQNEQMAMWKRDIKKEERILIRSLNGKQVWREFGSILADARISLLIQWHNRLLNRRCIKPDYMLRYEFVAIAYDKSQHSSVDNIFSDSLSLHLNLLSELGESYRLRITDMIARCDKIANTIGLLGCDLYLASGGDPKKTEVPDKAMKEQYYFEIDVPFRKWLASLDAGDSSETREQKIEDWCKRVSAIAQKLAKKMVSDAGQPAYIGKMVSDGKEKKYISSSLAMNRFKYRINKIERT